MPSQITILPASTQAGKETIRALLQSKQTPKIKAIYRDPAKAPKEFIDNPNFEAVKGDISTGTGIDFEASEAVLYIPPPTYDGRDSGEFAKETANCVREALKRASSVNRLVVHSALGAYHDPDKLGVLKLNNFTDQILEKAAPQVMIVRPCYYYQTWAEAIKHISIDSPLFESVMSPEDFKFPMIDIRDIGEYLAQALLNNSAQPSLQDIKLFGPHLYSAMDVKKAIEEVVGYSINLKTIPREELAEYWGKLLPAPYVQGFVDFTIAQLPGGVCVEDYVYDENTVRCERTLVDALRDMARVE